MKRDEKVTWTFLKSETEGGVTKNDGDYSNMGAKNTENMIRASEGGHQK